MFALPFILTFLGSQKNRLIEYTQHIVKYPTCARVHTFAMFVVYSVISRNLECAREWPWKFFNGSVNTVRKSWSCQNEAQTVKYSIFNFRKLILLTFTFTHFYLCPKLPLHYSCDFLKFRSLGKIEAGRLQCCKSRGSVTHLFGQAILILIFVAWCLRIEHIFMTSFCVCFFARFLGIRPLHTSTMFVLPLGSQKNRLIGYTQHIVKYPTLARSICPLCLSFPSV